MLIIASGQEAYQGYRFDFPYHEGMLCVQCKKITFSVGSKYLLPGI